MSEHLEFAAVASLMADPTRSEILLALMDGRAFPVTDLAAISHVSLATASHHLSLLVKGGLVSVVQNGRHRYHRLANAEVAQLIEQMGVIASGPARPLSATQQTLVAGRACYSHLAGRIGVQVRLSLDQRGFIQTVDQRYLVTDLGSEFLQDLGVCPQIGKPCLDWTERVPHIGGKLGQAIFSGLLEREWIERTEVPRQIGLTKLGVRRFDETFPVVESL